MYKIYFYTICFACCFASCHSTRKNFKSDYQSNSETHRLDLRDLETAALIDLSSVTHDSIHLRITEYYRPPEGDTATRGPVRAEIEIVRGIVTKVDSSAFIIENIKEQSETNEHIATRQNEEIKIRADPWYLSWKVILTTTILIIIAAYFLLRNLL